MTIAQIQSLRQNSVSNNFHYESLNGHYYSLHNFDFRASSAKANNEFDEHLCKFHTISLSDFAARGKLKFGDKCETTQQCGFVGSICYQSYCTCSPELMSTNHVDKCGKGKSREKIIYVIQ